MTALPRQDQFFGDAIATTDDARPPDEQPTANGERQKPARPPVKQKSLAEVEREGVKRDYLQARGRPYKADIKDHAAWTELKKVAEIAEIEAGWRIGLAGTGYLQCNYIWQLAMKWNDIAAKLPRHVSTSLESDLPDCEACGVAGETWFRAHRLWLCTPCLALADVVAERIAAPVGLRLGDVRIGEFQAARDSAVSQWARERFSTRTRGGI